MVYLVDQDLGDSQEQQEIQEEEEVQEIKERLVLTEILDFREKPLLDCPDHEQSQLLMESQG